MIEGEPLLRFKGQLQLEHLKKLNLYRYHMRRKGSALFFLIFFSLFFLYMHYVMEFSVLATILIMLGGIVIGVIVGFSLLNRALTKEYVRDPAAHSEFIYTVTESGIEMESDRIRHFLGWEEFSAVFEYADMFILTVTPIKVNAIPKTFFNSTEEVEEFRRITNRKIPKK
ncbi:YcxB family protein [Jeotgalibaca sp. PTS2502]|jgi:hypothetical protein|uniref:YcxB family protein n=2 Tax=Jeotgalibaca TaxID=1470540 RepID=UPI0009FB3B48|nr:YcxB family protein [Jeotgalibaca sp. PTS2502]